MKKEKFYKPLIEVINLSDDIICTSPPSPENPFDPFDPSEEGTDAF